MSTVVSVQRLPGGKKRAQFRLVARMQLAAERETLYRLLSDPRELNGLTPAWFRLDFRDPVPDRIGVGTTLRYRLRTRGLVWRWESRIDAWEPLDRFSYVQTRGPYRWFWHDHRFEPMEGGTAVTDVVDYSLWGGGLANRIIEPWLREIFAFRGRLLAGRFGALAR
ncbi:MAG: SRPBCC family protein [Gemmatimonadetes bacterium]|nr:SRPBCC family protein [Gemmatimonadota bacterium]